MRLVNLLNQFIVLACLFLVTSGHAMASTNLQTDSFDVYVGDVDEDGYEDIYLKAKEKILLIASDITIPIPYQDSDSFFVSGLDGSIQVETGLIDVSDTNLFQPANFDHLTGDFDGNGRTDLLLKSQDGQQSNIIVYGSASENPVSLFTFGSLQGHDIDGEKLIIKDINGDGKDDIQIAAQGSYAATDIIAKSNGTFETTSDFLSSKTIVGVTSNGVRVSQTGAAIYNYPINLPPTVGNIAPNLGISYNSNGRKGVLGRGWQINGLSYITRCSTNLERDNEISGVNIDSTDQYCLGGSRLIPVNNGENGADGTEYRTEIDSFSKIISYGTLGNGPAYFKVWTKSGLINEYGNTSDSQIEAQGKSEVVVWAINKQSDHSGNYYTVDYDEDSLSGEWHVSQINLNDRSTNNTYVKFTYQVRSDVSKSYLAGSQFQTSEFLSNIKIYVDGVRGTTKQYNFNYSGKKNEFEVTTLRSIQECFQYEACLPAVTFTWTSDAAGLENGFSDELTGPSWSTSSGWGNEKYYSTIQYADINKDGKVDVCARNSSYFDCYVSDETGSSLVTLVRGPYLSDAHSFDQARYYKTIKLADVNGDGYPDICRRDFYGIDCYLNEEGAGFASEKSFHLNWSNGNSWDQVRYYQTIGYADINGDGRADICGRGFTGVRCFLSVDGDVWGDQITGPGYSNSAGYSSAAYYSTIRYVDINGDGMSDICARTSQKFQCHLSNGNGFDTVYEGPSSSGTLSDVSIYSTIAYPDLNQDGLPEMCLRKTDGMKCYQNNGVDFKDVIDGPDWTNAAGWSEAKYYSTIRYADINVDGNTDICARGSSGIQCYLGAQTSTGYKFSQKVNGPVWTGSAWDAVSQYSTISFKDVNGDGLSDVCGRSSTGIVCQLNKNAIPLISSIDSGVGVPPIEVDYLPLSSDVYTLSSTANYPTRDIRNSAYVVSKVTMPDGVGGEIINTYQYEGLKYHLTARQSLGFAKKFITSHAHLAVETPCLIFCTGGVRTVVSNRFISKSEFHYNQNYRNRTYGMLEREILKNNAGIELSNIQNNVTATLWNNQSTSGGGYLYMPWVNQVITKTKDHDGVLINDSQVDLKRYSGSLGNIEKRTERNYTPGHDIPKFEETFTYKAADTDNWFIGQVDTHTQTSGDKTRTSEFTNYDESGRLTHMIIEPNDNPLTVTYSYDDFGNVETVTESAADITTRTSTTYYDAIGLYFDRRVNAANYTDLTVETIDLRFGLPTSILDANNLRTQISYDDLGRIQSQTNPDNTELSVDYKWCSSASVTCQVKELYAEIMSVTGQAPVTRYFDSLNRELRKKYIGFDGLPIYQNVVFNQIGDVTSTSEPYTGNTASNSTSIKYDGLWRPYFTINPDGSYRRITQFNGLELTEENERGNSKTTRYDPLGRVLKTFDSNATETSFVYGDFGNLEQTLVEGSHSLIVYDNRGRKISMTSDATGAIDVDAPRHFYSYNSLGEMITRTDPNGAVTCYAYDNLGRMVKRVDNYQGSLTTQAFDRCSGYSILQKENEWTYDTAENGMGLLHVVTGPQSYEKTYSYDYLSRLETESTLINASTQPYNIGYGYDEINGQHDLTLYPENFSTVKQYDANGYLYKISNAEDLSKVYYETTGMTERGQVSHFTYGNGLASVNSYNPASGRLESTTSGVGTVGDRVLERYYQWDVAGNLTNREDRKQNLNEGFTYDNLDRLETTTFTDNSGDSPIITSTTMSYYNNGNINFKPGVGTYNYDTIESDCIGQTNVASRFSDYAVRSISGTKNAHYCYDNNGNTLIGDGREMQYNINNQPTRITKGTDISDLNYDPEGALYLRTDNSETSTIETTYIGGIYEKEVNSGITKHKFYVNGFAVITQNENDSTNRAETYLHHDHLGSVVLITDAAADTIESFSFDAWGKRRSTIDYASTVTPTAMITTQQGFTGHQQMDNVGLIHMKGRVYDPTIGRFLSQDPIVQFPTLSQSFNRYTYVINSPLSFTDPSGYGIADKRNESEHQGGPKSSGAKPGNRDSGSIENTIENTFSDLGDTSWSGVESTDPVTGVTTMRTLNIKGAPNASYRNRAMGITGNDEINDLNGAQERGGGGMGPAMASALPLAAAAALIDGPAPIGDLLGGALVIGALIADESVKIHLTYTLTNLSGQFYVGKTSGYGDPYSIMMRRFKSHKRLQSMGFGLPTLDAVAAGIPGKIAIRGREQQKINSFGGVGSPFLANRIRGVSKLNLAGRIYHNASNAHFGEIAEFDGY